MFLLSTKNDYCFRNNSISFMIVSDINFLLKYRIKTNCSLSINFHK